MHGTQRQWHVESEMHDDVDWCQGNKEYWVLLFVLLLLNSREVEALINLLILLILVTDKQKSKFTPTNNISMKNY